MVVLVVDEGTTLARARILLIVLTKLEVDLDSGCSLWLPMRKRQHCIEWSLTNNE